MKKRKIAIRKFKGDSALARGIDRMERSGYQVDNQATRKALYSATVGVFTRKQINTVAFRLREDADGELSGSAKDDAVLSAAVFERALRRLGASDAERLALVENTDLSAVVDEAALAHD